MRIGLVDDDEDTLQFVAGVLKDGGHDCVSYRQPRTLLAALQRDTFDLLIVDWNMPEISGIEVLGWARSHLLRCPPVLMFTSRNDKDDISAALDAGADDFIVKPETGKVIAARVNAVLRRTSAQPAEHRFEVFGRYRFDRLTETVIFDDEAIELTAKEFALSRLFFSSRGRPLSRSYILATVWKNVAELSTRTLDMHVSRVRSKLRLRVEHGYGLQTVFGYGYRLECFDAEDHPA
jgi:DNA-binding response OmpR family regulator